MCEGSKVTWAAENATAVKMAGGAVKLIKENLTIVGVLLGLAIALFALRTTPTPLSSPQNFDALAQGGRPVLVEFYSNF
jgi:hypothetical protein